MKKALQLISIAMFAMLSNAAAQVVGIGSTVSIDATDSNAAEGTTNTATFTIARDGGDNSVELAVDLGLVAAQTDATAADFSLTPPLAGFVIPAGAASATITMTATDDFAAETFELITVEVLANANYTVGTNNQATAKIEANDFGVTNTNDFDSFAGNPTPAEREGTLRQAVENALSFGNNATITFSDDPFTVGAAQTIALTGVLQIAAALNIEGPGADQLTLQGPDLGRIIEISDDGDALAVEISGLTFTDGAAIFSGDEGRGGAIFGGSDDGSGLDLTITECAFISNRGIQGGAIAFETTDGTLLIQRCSFEDNEASPSKAAHWHSSRDKNSESPTAPSPSTAATAQLAQSC